MSDSELNQYEGTAKQLIEDINQLNKVALGEGAVACQVCGAPLQSGSPVSVYVYRPAGESTFEIGHVVCGDDGHDLTTHFTLGVRELLVDGRVGLCSDVATGACWPVLLDPSVRVVSTMESRAGRIVPETPTDDVPWVYGDALLDRTPEHDPHETPADENPPTDRGETVAAETDSDAATPAAESSSPGNGGDAVGTEEVDDGTILADGDDSPTASPGPASSANTDAVPADAVDGADSSPTDSHDPDETNGESGA